MLFGRGEQYGRGRHPQPQKPAAGRRRHVQRRYLGPQRGDERVPLVPVPFPDGVDVCGVRAGRAEFRHRERGRVVESAATVHVSARDEPVHE